MAKKAQTIFLTIFLTAGFLIQGCGKREEAAALPTADAMADATEKTPAPQEIAAAPKSDAPVEAKSTPPTAAVAKNLDGSFKAFVVYSDASAPDNHFDPSGWMGDVQDIKVSQEYTQNPHSGGTCIQIGYSAKKSQGSGWAGVYWQNPSNNWGTRPGGYDLTGAKKVTFWAKGEKGGERIEEFKVGGIANEYPDSDVIGIGPVVLTAEWQQYSIDLEGKDLSSISGGFCWVANADSNTQGFAFYLDDIKYE